MSVRYAIATAALSGFLLDGAIPAQSAPLAVAPDVIQLFAGAGASQAQPVSKRSVRRRHARKRARQARRAYRRGYRKGYRRGYRRSYGYHRPYRRHRRSGVYFSFEVPPVIIAPPATVYVVPPRGYAPSYSCEYWRGQCARNWRRRSDFLGCLRYQGCL